MSNDLIVDISLVLNSRNARSKGVDGFILIDVHTLYFRLLWRLILSLSSFLDVSGR